MKEYIKPDFLVEKSSIFDVVVMSNPSGEDPWGSDIWD